MSKYIYRAECPKCKKDILCKVLSILRDDEHKKIIYEYVCEKKQHTFKKYYNTE